MVANRATAVVEDPRYRRHQGPDGHPERPERLEAVHAALAARSTDLDPVEPRPATDEEILRVHSADHLRTVAAAASQAPARIDADTYVSPESLDVALLAAGASVDLALRVASGQADCAFAAVRPPGHHAESSQAMGFCLFNNIAVAARALQAEAGVERIMVYDWDVHHGNGTQHSFEQDPSVLYVSTHQFPYYPGTGDFDEAGRGPGQGSTLNVPLPAGCGDEEYVGAVQRLVAPAARAFSPEVVLVSCGFDAHADDPLAAMSVSERGYREMALLVRALADELCGGRLLFVLEGGYALSGLEQGTRAVLDAIVPAEAAPLAPTSALEPGSTLSGVVSRVAMVHSSQIPEIGHA